MLLYFSAIKRFDKTSFNHFITSLKALQCIGSIFDVSIFNISMVCLFVFWKKQLQFMHQLVLQLGILALKQGLKSSGTELNQILDMHLLKEILQQQKKLTIHCYSEQCSINQRSQTKHNILP